MADLEAGSSKLERRVFVPPKDARAEPVCLLDDAARIQRREPPEAFLALARRTDVADGAEFRFESAPGMWERVSTFVAEEGECCLFFAFEQWEEQGEVVLRITREEESGTGN